MKKKFAIMDVLTLAIAVDEAQGFITVSYTHLTLPTIYSV